MSAICVLKCFCACMMLFIIPTQSTNVTDEVTVSGQIKQLVQTVSSLQSESRVQQQKQAAVLSSVLSKLAETTNELTKLKERFESLEDEVSTLRDNYTSLQSEFTVMKKTKETQEKELTTLKEKYDSFQQMQQTVSGLQSKSLTMEQKQEFFTRFLHNITEAFHPNVNESGMGVFLNDTEKNVEYLQSEVNALKSELEDNYSNMTSMKADISKLHTEISSSEDRVTKLLQMDVAFQASFSAKIGHIDVNKGANVKFTKIAFNAGNGFNPHTGIFTVPVSGTYFFWITCIYKKESAAAISIVSNDQTIAYAYGHAELNSMGVIRGFGIGSLQKGDRVKFSSRQDLFVLGSGSGYGGALLHTR